MAQEKAESGKLTAEIEGRKSGNAENLKS